MKMDTTDLLQKLVNESRPVKRLPAMNWRFLTWLLPASFFCGMGIWFMGLRADLFSKFNSVDFYAESFALLALAIWTSLEALKLSVPGLRSKGWHRWLPFIGAVGWIVFLGIRTQTSGIVMDSHFICSVGIIGISLLPTILLFKIIGQAFPLEPRAVGTLAGVANAALAAFGMQFICSHDNPSHIAFWHLIPVLASGVIGGWVATKLFFSPRNSLKALMLLLSTSCFGFNLQAAESAHVKAEIMSDVRSIHPGTPFLLGVRINIEKGWHIYGEKPGQAGVPTKIKWQLPDGFTADTLQWPQAERFEMASLVYFGYENQTFLISKITPATSIQIGNVEFKARVTWLECSAECIPGGTDLSLTLPVKNSPADINPQWPVPVAPKTAPTSLRLILGALLFSFVGGLILNLMPCVLPVLSIKILGFVNQAAGDRVEILKHGFIFTLGVLISFWTLGGLILFFRAAGHQLGWGFQLQSPLFVSLLCTLFLLIGLNLMGVYEVGTSLVRLGGVTSGKSGVTNSFLSGVLATIVATPCTAPFMGSALGFALTQPPLVSMAIFTALGSGMAFPYLILSANPRFLKFVPKPGMWMDSFKQTMGFLMIAAVLWLGWVFGHQTSVDGLIVLLFCLLAQGMGIWLLGRGKMVAKTIAILLIVGSVVYQIRMSRTATHATSATEEKNGLTWEPYSEERIAALRKDGRPVFVDFSAAWCLTCQVNERVVFGSSEVLAKFKEKNIATLKGDWTSSDPIITATLQRFGRIGVPLNLLYFPNSDSAPEILPEILTPQIVLTAIEKIK